MKIRINEELYLSGYKAGDKDALVRHLNDNEIRRNLLMVPSPYFEEDAEVWIRQVAGMPLNSQFLIRKGDGEAIGGIGFVFPAQEVMRHQADVGYWLAKGWRGKGFMKQVLLRFCEHGFEYFKLIRISAHIFSTNIHSEQLLLSCGFRQEGYLEKFYMKNGKLIDAKLFSKLKTLSQ
ncbi:MAG: GNAT family protein [Bacteroidia bacterium]